MSSGNSTSDASLSAHSFPNHPANIGMAGSCDRCHMSWKSCAAADSAAVSTRAYFPALSAALFGSSAAAAGGAGRPPSASSAAVSSSPPSDFAPTALLMLSASNCEKEPARAPSADVAPPPALPCWRASHAFAQSSLRASISSSHLAAYAFTASSVLAWTRGTPQPLFGSAHSTPHTSSAVMAPRSCIAPVALAAATAQSTATSTGTGLAKSIAGEKNCASS
mmetsp:Transcript_8682/g.35150  ORF Transcript_8682/g.35150 Transcript_8682/m.35150 type:complete len:222 (-) Transcript_8682:798-1463(-)